MTPIAYETVQYLRKVNTVFNDKNRVFDMMMKVLSALPDFARNQVIDEMLPNIKFNTDIQVNADGTEIRKSNAPEFLYSPAELDTVVQISLPPSSGKNAIPDISAKLDALKATLGFSHSEGRDTLDYLASNPGKATYNQFIRGADFPRVVEHLTAAGFLAR